MIEKIIENVINQMIPHLDQGQLEHLPEFLLQINRGRRSQDSL